MWELTVEAGGGMGGGGQREKIGTTNRITVKKIKK